jgi:hypothetical protein
MNTKAEPAPEVVNRVESALAARKFAGLGPITRRQVEVELGIPRRVFERAVEALRLARKPICSGAHGYYLSEGPGDIQGCVAYLRRIALSHLRTLGSMKRLLEAVKADIAVDKMEGASREQEQEAGTPGVEAATAGVPQVQAQPEDGSRDALHLGMHGMRDGVQGVHAVC